MASRASFLPLPPTNPAHNMLFDRLKKCTGMTENDTTLFLAKLDEMNGCIAGSFVLESMIQKTFLHPYISDIDIWIPHTKSPFSLFDFFFEKYNFRRQSKNVNTEYWRMFHQIDGMYIVSPKDSSKDLKHIQIIAFKDKTMQDIVDGFDLTCVQAFFSKSKVYAKDSLLKEIGGNTKTTGVSPLALKSQSYMEWFRTLARLEKYMYRGFSVTHETWEKVIASINARINEEKKVGTSILFKLRMLPNQHHFSRIKLDNGPFNHFSGIKLDNGPFKHFSGIKFDNGPFKYSYNRLIFKTKRPDMDVPAKCFDVINYKDVKIENYLNNIQSRIVIIGANNKAIGYNVDDFKEMIRDPASIFYPCLPMNGSASPQPDFETAYVKVSLSDQNVYIPQMQAFQMLRKVCKIWKLVEYGKIERSFSQTARHGDYVSAFHCQDGTVLDLFDAHPIPTTHKEYEYASKEYDLPLEINFTKKSTIPLGKSTIPLKSRIQLPPLAASARTISMSQSIPEAPNVVAPAPAAPATNVRPPSSRPNSSVRRPG